MIEGIGIDVSEIWRFRKNSTAEFLKQIYTEKEIVEIRGSINWATNFAVKEAILKALGMGLYYGSYWHDLEFSGDQNLRVSGRVKSRLQKSSAAKIHFSAAKTEKYAVSFVLIEQKEACK